MARKKEGVIAERAGQVEDLVSAIREAVARQATARVALLQRADEAPRDELMRALAIWGLPREAHCVDQAVWREAAVETALRGSSLSSAILSEWSPRRLRRARFPHIGGAHEVLRQVRDAG